MILSVWGALSDERTGLSFVAVIFNNTCHLYLHLSASYIVESPFCFMSFNTVFVKATVLSFSDSDPLSSVVICSVVADTRLLSRCLANDFSSDSIIPPLRCHVTICITFPLRKDKSLPDRHLLYY
jgi:hypothetical protein